MLLSSKVRQVRSVRISDMGFAELRLGVNLVVPGRSSSPGIKVLKRLKIWVVSPEVKLPLTELKRFDFGWGETSAALYYSNMT